MGTRAASGLTRTGASEAFRERFRQDFRKPSLRFPASPSHQEPTATVKVHNRGGRSWCCNGDIFGATLSRASRKPLAINPLAPAAAMCGVRPLQEENGRPLLDSGVCSGARVRSHEVRIFGMRARCRVPWLQSRLSRAADRTMPRQQEPQPSGDQEPPGDQEPARRALVLRRAYSITSLTTVRQYSPWGSSAGTSPMLQYLHSARSQ